MSLKTAKHLSDEAPSIVFGLLLAASLVLWSFTVGQLTMAVAPSNGLQEVHREYNHIRIYEDGSYEGQDIQGQRVTGCIEGALCDEEDRL